MYSTVADVTADPATYFNEINVQKSLERVTMYPSIVQEPQCALVKYVRIRFIPN